MRLKSSKLFDNRSASFCYSSFENKVGDGHHNIINFVCKLVEFFNASPMYIISATGNLRILLSKFNNFRVESQLGGGTFTQHLALVTKCTSLVVEVTAMVHNTLTVRSTAQRSKYLILYNAHGMSHKPLVMRRVVVAHTLLVSIHAV